jgi:hypothetical protein
LSESADFKPKDKEREEFAQCKYDPAFNLPIVLCRKTPDGKETYAYMINWNVRLIKGQTQEEIFQIYDEIYKRCTTPDLLAKPDPLAAIKECVWKQLTKDFANFVLPKCNEKGELEDGRFKPCVRVQEWPKPTPKPD